MKRTKVIISFRQPVPQLIAFSRNIINRMTDNEALFPNPDVPFSELKSAIDTLECNYNAAQGGGKTATLLAKESQKALLELLRTQALYVEKIAKGVEFNIVKSGFVASKQPSPYSRADFSACKGKMNGDVVLRCKRTTLAKSWIWQSSFDPDNAIWEYVGFTIKSTLTVNSLELGKRYWFRVSTVGSKGQSEWSNPISIIAT